MFSKKPIPVRLFWHTKLSLKTEKKNSQSFSPVVCLFFENNYSIEIIFYVGGETGRYGIGHTMLYINVARILMKKTKKKKEKRISLPHLSHRHALHQVQKKLVPFFFQCPLSYFGIYNLIILIPLCLMLKESVVGFVKWWLFCAREIWIFHFSIPVNCSNLPCTFDIFPRLYSVDHRRLDRVFILSSVCSVCHDTQCRLKKKEIVNWIFSYRLMDRTGFNSRKPVEEF